MARALYPFCDIQEFTQAKESHFDQHNWAETLQNIQQKKEKEHCGVFSLCLKHLSANWLTTMAVLAMWTLS